jgi:transcriptional regulator GlxA family with amidase domain
METIMNRREFGAALAAVTIGGALPQPAGAQTATGARLRVGMLVHPDMILLDLVAPLTAFNIMQTDIHLFARTKQAVVPDVGLPVMPTDSFETAPETFDVLFVPGGLKGSIEAMRDEQTIAFLKARGATARFVTSVCTGSLVLGAAGLLKGYNATSHWYARDLLPLMGATVQNQRVVEDRNRITAGGVTAGLDFALTIAARLAGEETAKRIQLLLEYDPKPPFDAGSPEGAGEALTADLLRRRAPAIREAEAAARAAGARMNI